MYGKLLKERQGLNLKTLLTVLYVARDTMLTRFCIIASFNGDRPCFQIYEKADIGWVVQDLQGALVNADSIARKVQ